MKTKSLILPSFLLVCGMTLSSASAALVAINSTNFSVTNTTTPPAVSNSYTGTGHVGLRYIGGTNYLSTSQTFTMEFNFSGGAMPSSGVGFWFGSASNANWIFVNEEAITSSDDDDQLRNFTERNLQTHGGSGTVTTDIIPDADFAPGATFTLTAIRTVTGGNATFDAQVRNSSNALIANLDSISTGTDADWGVTIFANSPQVNGITLTTTTITSLNIVPEPSAALLSLLGAALLVARRRRVA